MTELTTGVSLVTVFLVAIITTAVGVMGKIIFDWLKSKKNDNDNDNEGMEKSILTKEKINEMICEVVKKYIDDFNEKLTIIETNHTVHLQKDIDKNSNELLNIWKEINEIKKQVASVASDVSFIKGRMNGGK